MRLEIIAVDRIRAAWASEAVQEYLGRVARYCEVAHREVRPARGDGPRAVEEEGARLIAAAGSKPGTRLVALTPGGEALSSESWAGMISAWQRDGVRRGVFLVGGAGGLSPAALAKVDRELSLGPQTLSHELAQVVLAEQLYRAFTILRGERYHK
ncbi:MAG: 23S rRNA (pseudouridine(1915)-N(3))-methyltransferase RlmH [Gemmatimonadota bacterium]